MEGDFSGLNRNDRDKSWKVSIKIETKQKHEKSFQGFKDRSHATFCCFQYSRRDNMIDRFDIDGIEHGEPSDYEKFKRSALELWKN